jgi:hypothetical protein
MKWPSKQCCGIDDVMLRSASSPPPETTTKADPQAAAYTLLNAVEWLSVIGKCPLAAVASALPKNKGHWGLECVSSML